MARDTVLIVDDLDINREILVDILEDDYDLLQAKNGFEAVEMVMNNQETLSLVLLDIMMPEMDGFEVLDILRSSGYLARIPVIFITASSGDENEIKGLTAGAVDFVGKPFHPEIVKRRVASQIELRKYRVHLEHLVEINVQKVLLVRETIVDFLASVIEYRDNESGQHVKRTRLLADKLIDHVIRSGQLRDELQGFDRVLFSRAVPLHDIGKITTPDHILNKPGKLTPEEFEIIKQHTVMGAEIINRMDTIEDPEYIRYCRDICLYHHERWGGKGYPCALVGKEIPLSARVMSIVDVYDALTSTRPYKTEFSHEQAMSIITQDIGTKFDPVIGQIFIDYQDEFRTLSLV